MAKILVVGSANMDLIAPVARLPAPGETMLTDDIRLAGGGKGANAAVAASRLGARVRFIGAVGDDAFGETIRANLERNRIDCALLARLEGGSGTAVILLDRDSGENSILVGPGANARFELPAEEEPFAWADAVMLQLETPLEINREAARRGRAAGARVILDPAPARDDLPDSFLADCHIVSPNETELEILAGTRPGSDLADVEKGARRLMDRGAGEVVVKLGSRGALYVHSGGALHLPAPAVDAADTTAAGDAFTGALAFGLVEGRGREGALKLAVRAGALACTKSGAQPSLPGREEIETAFPDVEWD
jgi:ribokinase